MMTRRTFVALTLGPQQSKEVSTVLPQTMLSSSTAHTRALRTARLPLKRAALFALRACSLALAVSLLLCAHASADGIKKESPAQAEFKKGLAQFNLKNYADAEASFKRAIQLDPKYPAPYLGLSDLSQQKGDQAAAATFLRKAVALAPDNSGVQAAWGHFLFNQKKFPEAEQALRKAVQLDPKSPGVRSLLGDLYFLGLKKAPEAITFYKESLALNPSDAHTNFMLGVALLASGKPDEGEQQFVKARDADPKDPVIRKNLANLELRRDELDPASQNYQEASNLVPKEAWPQIGIGDVSLRRKDYKRAAGAYQTALTLDPKSAEAQTKLAMSQDLSGDHQSAEMSYKKALEMDPKDAVAANNLAWLLAIKEKRPKDGLPWAEKAVAINPQSPNFQDTRGWIMYTAGDAPGALTALKKAAELAPQNPSILYHLGVVYQELGKSSLASENFTKALAIDKNFDGADDALRRLSSIHAPG